MQKRLFSVLMSIVMVFSILPTFVFAETGDTFTVEAMHEYMPNPVPVSYKVLTEDANGGTVAVAGQGSNPAISTNTTGTLTLPDTVENNGKTYTVTEIDESAFKGCTNLNWIYLPSSLTKIGAAAFESCTSLYGIEIPNSVTNIGDNAFKDCSELYFFLNVSKIPAQLGNDAFLNCASDLEIKIPQGTKQAYIDAGWPEAYLVEIFLFEGKVLDTYSNPISGATVSVYDKNEEFKGSVTTDANGYFNATDYVEYGMEYTAKIEKSDYMTMSKNFIPKITNVTTLTYYVISLAKSDGGFSANTVEGAPITYQILTKDETSKTGTVRVVYGPGSLYNGLITLPNTVTYDGITYTVTEIGDYAFSDHYNLSSIFLPSSLTKIDESAFNNCGGTIVSYYKIPAKVTDITFYNFHGMVYIPQGTKQAYIDAGWPKIFLREISLFEGTVTDTYSNPISGATVSVYDKDGNLKNSVTTDVNGYFDATDNLEYGVEYTAKIEKSDYMTMSRNFIASYSLALGSEYFISLATSDGGFSSDTVEKAPITYQILTKDETSKTGTVRVVYGPGSLWSESITLPNTVIHDGITYTVTEIGDNAFYRHHNTTFVALPSGLKTVNLKDFSLCTDIDIISNNQNPPKCVTEYGLVVVQPTVYIPAGTKQAYIDAGWETEGLTFIEVAFSSLSGKVVDENGNSIADAKVTIYNDSGYQESVYTDSEGRYSFNNYFLNSEFVNSYVENGCNKIRVEKAGYLEYVIDLELFEGDITNIGVTLSPAPPNNPAIPTNNPNEANTTQTSINNTPQTGDNSGTIIYIAFGCMLIAILAVGCLVIKKKS